MISQAGIRRHEAARRAYHAFALLLITLVTLSPNVAAAQTGSGDESTRVHWKPVSEAQVKIDDKTPLGWNIYQPDKKDKKERKKDADQVLLLLGHRYLMVDIKERVVYEVALSEIKAQGTDFESGDLAQQSRLVPSSDWTVRDVGPAELITFTLGDYGRVLQVTLPHPPDMRPFY
jgi:hypothetical protein